MCVWVWVRPNKPLSGSQPTLHVLSQHTCTSLNLKLQPNELVRRSHSDASISVTDTWEETVSSQYVFSYYALEWMPKKKRIISTVFQWEGKILWINWWITNTFKVFAYYFFTCSEPNQTVRENIKAQMSCHFPPQCFGIGAINLFLQYLKQHGQASKGNVLLLLLCNFILFPF